MCGCGRRAATSLTSRLELVLREELVDPVAKRVHRAREAGDELDGHWLQRVCHDLSDRDLAAAVGVVCRKQVQPALLVERLLGHAEQLAKLQPVGMLHHLEPRHLEQDRVEPEAVMLAL